jgi:hypothetical protein
MTTAQSLLVTRRLQRQSGAIFPKLACIWRSDKRDRNIGAPHLDVVEERRAKASTGGPSLRFTDPCETQSAYPSSAGTARKAESLPRWNCPLTEPSASMAGAAPRVNAA